jgi:3-dehydroquinate dehydratase
VFLPGLLALYTGMAGITEGPVAQMIANERDKVAGYIEAHLSNPQSREPFRQHSYFSDLAKAVICGFGPDSYRFALTQLMQWFPASAADTP